MKKKVTNTKNLPLKNPSEYVVIPDIRQSMAHTALAFGFVLINLQNPYKDQLLDNWINAVVFFAMPIAAIISWVLFFIRLGVWKKIPLNTRAVITKTPETLKNRAISHLLISLLASGLTAIGYIGHLISPVYNHFNVVTGKIIIYSDIFAGIVSIAIISSSVRDIIVFAKNRIQKTA
ncbi:MAG: hypothetical protein JXR91_04170 [Deltaproteobacteria bacterium]|nr:hypothetical protein [Deltaproteobacteria bacterium]